MGSVKKSDSGMVSSENDKWERTIATIPPRTPDRKQEDRAFILFISGSLMGKMYSLDKEETVIGRAAAVDIGIRDTRVSRLHARILLSSEGSFIEDLESTNGTLVNGERITTRELKNGDKVYLPGDNTFKFAIGDEAERLFQKEMYQLANYDAVTQIPNKHVFTKHLREIFSFSTNMNWGLALLMIDIDCFKNVNDSYGHQAGDHILRSVAQRIRKSLRDENILARYGGDEMGAILPYMDTTQAVAIAERIRTAIADVPFYYHSAIIPVTVSIGVAALSRNNSKTPEELIAQADACLYRSKQNGRNRVTF